MKLALVYDRVNKFGGAERVLLALHEIWPEAPLFTSVYNPKDAPWAKDFEVIPSFLQKFPWASIHHELYSWLMPLAFESFNFDDFDVVISVTSEFAKGIITKPQALHFCYCLTPTRYLWSGYQEYFRTPWFKFLTQPLVSYLRTYDQIVAQRADDYLAISENVRRRIKKYYGRNATVIYPGIDVQMFKCSRLRQGFGGQAKFFLIVSRLVPYKRIDIAIQAFNQLGWPLKIVGAGSEERRLKRMANSNIEFLGQNLTDEELLGYYQNCQALVFAGSEDFCLVSLEAQTCGKPVIAFRGGGLLETIIEGKTGIFFKKQTASSLIQSLKKFKSLRFKPEDCRRQAEKFDVEIFKRRFKEFVMERWQKHKKNLKLK